MPIIWRNKIENGEIQTSCLHCIHDKLKLANLIVISSFFLTLSVFSKLFLINKILFTDSCEWGMWCLLWVQGMCLNLYVVAVVYAASCCSYEPWFNETAWCKNIKYSSLRRYPSLFDTSTFRGSLNDHSINILTWHSFQLKVRNPIIHVNFQAFWLQFSSQN